MSNFAKLKKKIIRISTKLTKDKKSFHEIDVSKTYIKNIGGNCIILLYPELRSPTQVVPGVFSAAAHTLHSFLCVVLFIATVNPVTRYHHPTERR